MSNMAVSCSYLHFKWTVLVAVGRTNLKQTAVVFWAQEKEKLVMGTKNI